MITSKPTGLLTLIIALAACISCTESKVAILPVPASCEWGRGTFVFTPRTVISVEDEQQRETAEWFAWLFAGPAGFVPKVDTDAASPDIIVREDASLPDEAYRIKVTRRRIRIEASSPAGFFYAFQTLRYALPPEFGSLRHADNVVWTVPSMKIEDAPGYSHRCLRLDVTEHHVPVSTILAFVESMAMLKLNNLHLIMAYDGYYTRDDYDVISDFATENRVVLTPDSGCLKDLYEFPDGMASNLFPDIAAVAQVAWTAQEVSDIMHFNEAVDRLGRHMRYRGLYVQDVILNVAVATFR